MESYLTVEIAGLTGGLECGAIYWVIVVKIY